jgi:hypothetical protein
MYLILRGSKPLLQHNRAVVPHLRVVMLHPLQQQQQVQLKFEDKTYNPYLKKKKLKI